MLFMLEEVIKREEEKHVLTREGLLKKCVKSVQEGTGKYFKRKNEGSLLV